MKKKWIAMIICALTCMPLSVFGEAADVPRANAKVEQEPASEGETEQKEEAPSDTEQEKKVEDSEVTAVNDTVTVAVDTDVLDYPGRKEGTAIGEVLEEDEVKRTGTIGDTWSRILYEDENGEERTGYIPTSVLEGYQEKDTAASTATSDGSVEAGIIHKSSGQGIFAEAVEGVTQTGVQEGQAVMASADSALRPLGVFHITHYCQCSICCGPWANGITSTGVIATTNRTVAVDPTVIPYGSKVVIGGQVYVAEDCGGAIKNNRIDIYMGSHAEAENSGVFDVEVYLLEEGNSSDEDLVEIGGDSTQEEGTEADTAVTP